MNAESLSKIFENTQVALHENKGIDYRNDPVFLEFSKLQPRSFATYQLKEGTYRWPWDFTRLKIEGLDILLWPRTVYDQPGIAVHGCDSKTALKFINRFLSGLCWATNSSIELEDWGTSSGNINPCTRQKPGHIPHLHKYYLDEDDYIPLPSDPKQRLVLALYREALYLGNKFYKFLSFYKIINSKFSQGPAQKDWIKANLQHLHHHYSDSYKKLSAKQNDIPDYLYKNGRCAISHAYNDPLVNPDDPEHHWEINEALPIIKGLAEIMIEREYGIKSNSTNYSEHLYELKGFSDRLGLIITEQLNDGNIPDFELNDLAQRIAEKLDFEMTIKLRESDITPFKNYMVSQVKVSTDGKVLLSCVSIPPIVVKLLLDFPNQKLTYQFEITGGDDGSVFYSKFYYQYCSFMGYLYGNGVFQIYGPDEKLLSRLDAFIPVNIIGTRYPEMSKEWYNIYTHRLADRTLNPKQERLKEYIRLLNSTTCWVL